MRDWIIISVIGIVSLAVVAWTIMRKPRATHADRTDGVAARPVAPRAPNPERIGLAPAHPSSPKRAGVPNTTVPPNPEDLPIATLEFEGPPGNVPIRRGEIMIGRHSDDDVRVQDVRVSRHHARLVARSEGAFEIHNLTAVRSEPNPVLVNGEAREHAVVGDGDVITLGGVSFRLRLAQSAS